jgi:hypothetical protein
MVQMRCNQFRALLLALSGLSAAAGMIRGQTLRIETVSPQATDPAITQWLSPHYVILDTSASLRNQLFVFMHGLNGSPGSATELLKTAGMERYHVVGITYPNDWVPFNYCADGGDPDCYENLPLEIIEGTDHSSHVAVDRVHCFENRLIKLLQFENNLHPGEGWGQFLSGDTPNWSQMAVWGHSQGGSNAAVLAKHHAVARLMMSAPPADSVPGGYAAWWNTHDTASPSYFGFCHTQDQLSSKVAVWNRPCAT